MQPTTYLTLGSILLTIFVLFSIFFVPIYKRIGLGHIAANEELGLGFWKHSFNHWLWKIYMLIYAMLLSWIILGMFGSMWYIHIPGLLVWFLLEESASSQWKTPEKFNVVGRILTIYVSTLLLVGLIAKCIELGYSI